MAEYNIDSIVMPNGEAQEITAIVMPNGDEYTFGGGVTPTGNIDITQAGVTDVTNYATATVPTADPWIGYSDTGFFTENNQRKWHTRPVVSFDERQVGWMDADTTGNFLTYAAVPTGTSVTPTESAQTIGGANRMMEGAVTVNAIPSNYVGSGVARKSSSDLTASGATVTVPAGYYASSASKSVASGSATPAASISGTSATVSTGTNTLTLSKTVSNTPQVSAGYVSSGTAGNSNVSLTASVTTKAAATITPGTTNQTIASGTYLTGTQTISGDANLVAGNIKNGTTIFGVTGTYSGGGGTLTVATKTASLSAVGQTLSFTGLLGTPKYWFVKTTSQISSSGSTTIYYITDGFWDGTSVKGNSFRIGSTRRIYSWTAGVSQSYSGGTLTITGGSATGASPGQFFNGNYELTYVY